MKRNLLKTIIITTGFISAAAFANDGTNPDGYYGNQNMAQNGVYGSNMQNGFPELNTVAAIKNSKMYMDDFHVSLTGTLTKQLSYEHYEFTDATGTITVEIEADKMWGQKVSAQTPVTIYGEIDHEGYGLMIDVDMLRVAS